MTPTYAVSSWFFIRALALIYVIAFVSLAVQTRGLFGSRGILPIAEYLKAVESQTDKHRYWQLPSVFWMESSDSFLVTAAWAGALAGAAAFLGFAQGWMLLICFVLYLAFVAAGQDFLSFQWDVLLLEVGFAALLIVPWAVRFDLGTAYEPHWLVRWVFYAILFKLMFLSGVVKLLSGDESWRDLTALTYHYWTQPLPNPLAPFVHALPAWVHKISTALTFVIELAVPFLMFWPRARVWAAGAFIALSFLILTTGNYTFFNWLTIALAFWLIPDEVWYSLTRALPFEIQEVPAPIFPNPAASTVALALLALTFIWCVRWTFSDGIMAIVSPVLRVVQSFHVNNTYGLFANMTKSRPEIVIEGSSNGVDWKEYEFKFKPGGLYHLPPVVAPHQPRLDWQMWFAALGSFRQNYWLQNFLVRLFEGSPDVRALLAWDPFAESGEKVKYLRLRLYEYEFTPPGEILRSGQWWKRSLIGEYSPTFSRP